MITVIGIFDDGEAAQQAASYLLANEFEGENVDIHTGNTEQVNEFFDHLFEDRQEAAAHAALARDATIITVHALGTREAQEAADVFSNYGSLDVSIPGSTDKLSRIVEKAVNHNVRLRGVASFGNSI